MDKKPEKYFTNRGRGRPKGSLNKVPAQARGMILAALARRWGISKSGVKGLVDGSRRGQVGPTVSRAPSQRERVRAWVSLTLAERAKLRRLGGSKFVRRALESMR